MFQQLLMPVAGSLLLSLIAAALSVAVVFALRGIMRRQASLAGLIVNG